MTNPVYFESDDNSEKKAQGYLKVVLECFQKYPSKTYLNQNDQPTFPKEALKELKRCFGLQEDVDEKTLKQQAKQFPDPYFFFDYSDPLGRSEIEKVESAITRE